jgi:GT2 family glycosyltransferase
MPAAMTQQPVSSITSIPEDPSTTFPDQSFAVVARLAVPGSIEEARVAGERLVAHLDSGPASPGGCPSVAAAVRLYLGLVPFATADEHAAEALREELAARYTGGHHHTRQHQHHLSVHLETFCPSTGVGTVADVWQALGGKAFEQGADYVVLWHTAEAAFSDPAWTRHLLDEVNGLARALAASLGEADLAPALTGFGCVALLSEDRPRARFDLVLPRAHYESLGNHVLAPAWLADAANGGPSVDRRLYYTYAKLNAARPSTRCGLLHGKEVGGGGSSGGGGGGCGLSGLEMVPPTARLQISDEDETVLALADHLVARLGQWTKKERGSGGSGSGGQWDGSALALLRRRGLPPSLDVVVPTYRVDMELLQGICGTAPANQGSLTYVVVDDPGKVNTDNWRSGGGGGRPTPMLTVPMMQRRLSQAKPALVLVNSVNMGVTRSRNRGLEASGAEWIVFQDDDVVPDVALLKAYSEAIARHASSAAAEAMGKEPAQAQAQAQAQGQRPVVGFCGMIHFPEPFNAFTAALRMSGVTNAFEIAQLTPEPVWGCTANVCMRNGPWLRFAEDWEKCGGGEDIDFFLRLRDVGRVRSAFPAAAVHPWWTDGRRSYWHFRMWGLGDGRLQKLYPEQCYRSAPCAVETLLAVAVVGLAPFWLAAYSGLLAGSPMVTPRWVLQLAAIIFLGVLEVDMLGNVLCDRLLLRVVNSESLGGWRRTLGAMEAALILGFAELGRLQYHLRHPNGRLRDIGVRFDFYCGKIPRARRAWQLTYALKFVGFLVYGIGVQVWWVASLGRHGGPWGLSLLPWMATALLHTGCVAYLASLMFWD